MDLTRSRFQTIVQQPRAVLVAFGFGRLEGARPLHHYDLALSAAVEALAVDAAAADLGLS